MSPASSSISAWRSLTVAPAFPRTASRHQPTMFWPRSKTNTPGFGSVRRTGFSSSVTRIGSFGCATSRGPAAAGSPTSTGCHDEASNPTASQPGISRRAS